MAEQNQVYPYGQIPTTSSWAIISLISGVLAWLGLFGLGGIAAVICGHVAKNEIHKHPTTITGDGLATIGLVLGYLNIILVLLGICLAILVIAGVIAAPAICIPYFNSINWEFSAIP